MTDAAVTAQPAKSPSLGGQTLVYSVGAALRQGIAFLLIPIYTRFLSPADYGVLELFNLVAVFLVTVGTQGLGTAFVRFLPDCADEDSQRKLAGTAHLWLLLSSLILCGVPIAMADGFAALLVDNGSPWAPVLQLSVAYGCFQIAAWIPMQMFRARLQAGRFIATNLIGFVIQLSLSIWLVVGVGLGVQGVVLGQMIAALSVAILAYLQVRRHFTLTIDTRVVRKIVPFGWPFIVVGLCWLVLEMSDRLLLEHLGTTTELGLYSLGAKFTNVLRIALIAPFATAWGAMCFRIAKQPDAGSRFGQVTHAYVLVLCAAATALVIWIAPVLRVIVGPEFQDARLVVLPLTLGVVFAGVFQFFTFGLALTERTRYIAFIVLGGGALNIGLNIVAIQRWGMLGAAWVSFAAYAAIAVVTFAVSQRLYRIPVDLVGLAKVCVPAVCLCVLAHELTATTMLADIGWRLLLTVVFVLTLRVGGALGKEQLAELKSLFGRG